MSDELDLDEMAAFDAAASLNNSLNGDPWIHTLNFVQGANWRRRKDYAELARLREALEFYANESNWMQTRKDHLHTAKMTIIGDPRSFGQEDGTLLIVGGKTAEAALKTAGEGEK